MQNIIQQNLFTTLSNHNTKEHSVVYTLMDLLGIKKGAAYKRMNGSTKMSIDEVLAVTDHYNLSLDAVFGREKHINFYHPFLHKEKSDLNVFVDQYKKFFSPLEKLPPSEEVSLSYLSNELPIFYYFGHKYILNFMIAVWRHLHWDDVSLKIEDASIYEDIGKDIRQSIVKSYYKRNVTEIWNSNMLNNLYQQILFCISIRAFDNSKLIKLLINDIANLLQHLREVCNTGKKSIKGDKVEEGNLKIYLNEFGNYLNILQFHSPSVKSTFIGYDYPQFIVSHNQPFYNFSKDWIERLKKRSVLISSEGYQYREVFFMKMQNDYDYFKQRVEKMMAVYY